LLSPRHLSLAIIFLLADNTFKPVLFDGREKSAGGGFHKL
jgi:hypothetical protein